MVLKYGSKGRIKPRSVFIRMLSFMSESIALGSIPNLQRLHCNEYTGTQRAKVMENAKKLVSLEDNQS